LFKIFWSAYPVTKGQSKKDTFTRWQTLSEDDQDKAFNSLTPYKAHLKKTEYACKHALTYLNGRTWESFETPVLALVAAEEIKLESSRRDHMFLIHCRAEGASESDISYWLGKFNVGTVDGVNICYVDKEMADFDSCFGKTVKRLGYSIWTRELFERRTG